MSTAERSHDLRLALDATLSMEQRQVDFDRDDVDGAIAELDRMHSQSEAI
jgi:hypothetical protein